MAVAWSKDKVGHATADVTVRDPVVLSATLPRFLLPGDRSTVHLDLDNVEGAPGDYTIAVSTADAVIAGAGATQKLTLRATERGAVTVPIIAGAAGSGAVKVSVSGPSGFALERNFVLAVRSPAQIVARRTVQPLAKGESSDAVGRHVRRSRSRHRRGFDLGRGLRGARCGESACRARSLSVPLLGADHEPRHAAALSQRPRERGASGARARRRRAYPRHRRCAVDAAGRQRLVRPVERRRRRRLAQFLRHRFSHPRPRAQIRGAGCGVQAGARPAAQCRRRSHRSRQERRRRSRLCALCAGAQRRGADRRSTLPCRRAARCADDPDRQGATRRRARHGRRSRARRACLCGGARGHRRRAAARPCRPSGLRLDLARRRGAGDAGGRRRRRRRDRASRRGAGRRRARVAASDLDAGGCLAPACGERDRQGRRQNIARRQRRGDDPAALPHISCRRAARRRYGSRIPETSG